MSLFDYTENQATIKEIEVHLERCSDLFRPSLSSVVNINDYSTKIRMKAHTFECWTNNILVGLVACYMNDETLNNAFITNVSVVKEEQRKGIAAVLLSKTIEKASELGFIKISLEVYKHNSSAIEFYKQFDFVFSDSDEKKYIMTKWLKKEDN